MRIARVGAETADIYGEIRHNLRLARTPIPINDIWIAAQTIELGASLITFDTHFTKVNGLRRVEL